MNRNKPAIETVDSYIASFSTDIQKKLKQVRKAIITAAPGAKECISYRMPAYFLNGIIVYFAAYEKHIGFYPTSSGIQAFQTELSPYKSGKGSVQFPLDKPLPLDTIRAIVQFRVALNKQKA